MTSTRTLFSRWRSSRIWTRSCLRQARYPRKMLHRFCLHKMRRLLLDWQTFSFLKPNPIRENSQTKLNWTKAASKSLTHLAMTKQHKKQTKTPLLSSQACARLDSNWKNKTLRSWNQIKSSIRQCHPSSCLKSQNGSWMARRNTSNPKWVDQFNRQASWSKVSTHPNGFC